ncbi:hypothetical protein AX16_005555 [Volvariella volvacea WC 439]|nr:hypothetical protein AX16_005555 [Volvariella volvacea WC 439]
MVATPPLHMLPVSQRPPNTWSAKIRGALFCILFNFGCLMINGSQFVFLLPLRFLPFLWARQLYDEGIRYTKGAFGCLLILMCQWFAPTSLKITFEKEGMGKFSDKEIEQIVVRDAAGNVTSLNLPDKFILIANHQVYADWWYAWCLTYFVGLRGVHKHVFITLKKSLQWVPIVGWGMQFYKFIFLARSWAADRAHLAESLDALGKNAEQEDRPFCFLLYPEGTLVSQNTRPVSKKFADKMGISDLSHMLLPRSTGLHYSLRSLTPRIPELRLIDMTMVYPGIPPMGYGQSYYTLRSIFLDGVPPPEIHIHLRMFEVMSQVPIGNHATQPLTNSKDQVEIPEDEKTVFDVWLRKLWKEKDDYVTSFFEQQAAGKPKTAAAEIPVRLRRLQDVLDAFCFFGPAALGYVVRRLRG